MPEAVGTQDYLGLNYYTTEATSLHPFHPARSLGAATCRKGAEVSPSGFIANEPRGFYRALSWARGFDLPIYITENGVEDCEDSFRRRYLVSHIHRLWHAVNYTWPVRGYFHWSLVDNFEWERGWTQRFGLWSLDEDTQERKKRPSADLYAEICKSNSLSSDMVAMYAPEVFEDLFPPRGSTEFAPELCGS